MIGLENRLVLVFAALVATGIHINGDERLGFVDDEITPTG